ncbi:MAG: hypothetical protein RSE46_24060, partial [Janthinobacterium sp.]
MQQRQRIGHAPRLSRLQHHARRMAQAPRARRLPLAGQQHAQHHGQGQAQGQQQRRHASPGRQEMEDMLFLCNARHAAGRRTMRKGNSIRISARILPDEAPLDWHQAARGTP